MLWLMYARVVYIHFVIDVDVVRRNLDGRWSIRRTQCYPIILHNFLLRAKDQIFQIAIWSHCGFVRHLLQYDKTPCISMGPSKTNRQTIQVWRAEANLNSDLAQNIVLHQIFLQWRLVKGKLVVIELGSGSNSSAVVVAATQLLLLLSAAAAAKLQLQLPCVVGH